MDLMEKHGRAGQWHNVTTEDGYILTVFRILPDPSACQLHDQKRVAFLQHGLEGAADFFILFGPTSSLGNFSSIHIHYINISQWRAKKRNGVKILNSLWKS